MWNSNGDIMRMQILSMITSLDTAEGHFLYMYICFVINVHCTNTSSYMKMASWINYSEKSQFFSCLNYVQLNTTVHSKSIWNPTKHSKQPVSKISANYTIIMIRETILSQVKYILWKGYLSMLHSLRPTENCKSNINEQ